MKELFGLKDENGKEYKLVQEVREMPHHSNTWIAEPVEPEPEFRVGQWAIVSCNGVDTDYLVRLDSVCPIVSTFWFNDFENNLSNYITMRGTFDKIKRPATKEEIEAHLRKIADEKYPFGTKFRSINDREWGQVREVQPYGDHKYIIWRYFIDDDYLFCDSGMKTFDKFCSNPTIYKHGKWAEIVPEKKKLPKTK